MPENLSFGIEKFGSSGFFCEPFSEGTKINFSLVTEVYICQCSKVSDVKTVCPKSFGALRVLVFRT